MGKKSKKKIVAAEPLSKKERKALKRREAELAAELAAREAERKAAKKKAGKSGPKKSGKKPKSGEIGDPNTPASLQLPGEAEMIAAAKAERKAKRAEEAPAVTIQSAEEARERAKPLSGDALKAAMEADTDAAIKARVEAKRAARERDERLAQMQRDVAANRAARIAEAAADAEAVEDAADAEARAIAAFDEAERAAAERRAIAKTREAVDAIKQAVDVVETEVGREFVAGVSIAAEEFGKPSEAPRDDFQTNGNGQYLVARPSDGKLVGYTRVTTYIDCLEDKTMLEKWKARILLEGVAAAEEMGDAVTAKVRDLAHNRDVAIAKARKADRKGKLEPGQLAHVVDGAWSDFKKALDKLADEVFEVGGGREKATKGTDIHELCMIASREGIQPIADKLTAGEITPSDLADVEAFLDAITRLGAKIIDVERVIVNDDLKVAGRLDYTAMVKLPGEARARRRVMDLKTGRIDYSMGKIAMQLGQYAEGQGYDLETHEREDLKLDRAKALVIHLPAGTGKPKVHVVNLTLARKGNRLAGDVRAWRNEGKRAIDLKVNVLDEIALAATEEG